MSEEMTTDTELGLEAFARGSVDLIEEKELAARLSAGEPLRVKFGMDPSSPDLHIGHAIPLLKLRDLQELGHKVVLIVGDSTAMVGDPSGKNQLRPQLSRDEVEANLVTYTEQAGKLLDLDRTEVRRNSVCPRPSSPAAATRSTSASPVSTWASVTSEVTSTA